MVQASTNSNESGIYRHPDSINQLREGKKDALGNKSYDLQSAFLASVQKYTYNPCVGSRSI